MASTQTVALKKLGYLNTFKKCPHCDERGGVWYAHPGQSLGWSIWCYLCGHREE